MIGKLRGLVDEVGEDWLILDVNGVGYNVNCPSRVLASLPPLGKETTLIIETYVREDQFRLFGFATNQERDIFRILQTVQGVGAKVAMAILGIMTPAEIANAVSFQDKAMITRTPGVGPKVAERIVTELKNKLVAFAGASPQAVGIAGSTPGSSTSADAVSALTNLGYSREQAASAVARIVAKEGGETPTEKLIRLGLRELATA